MDDKESLLLQELENGFKLEKKPFKRLANRLGLTESEVISIIKRVHSEGIIRRIGIAVRPEKLGHACNALVTWKAPEDRMDELGQTMASCRQISHCYERECPPGWPFNLFTMIHARTPQELTALIDSLSEKTGLTEYKIFKTVRELKKTSMKYFQEKVNE